MTVDIKPLVDRFLAWKLPETFYPDCFVNFDREHAKQNNLWPIGTNILTADEAKAMFEYVLAAPAAPAQQAQALPEREAFEQWWATGAGDKAGSARGWLGAAESAWCAALTPQDAQTAPNDSPRGCATSSDGAASVPVSDSPNDSPADNAEQQADAGGGRKVGCEGVDGLLRIHAESELCDVCSRPPTPVQQGLSDAKDGSAPCCGNPEACIAACVERGRWLERQKPQELPAMSDEDKQKLADERKANRELRDAVWNLMQQKGRHNTEAAYYRLEPAYLKAVKASPILSRQPSTESKP